MPARWRRYREYSDKISRIGKKGVDFATPFFRLALLIEYRQDGLGQRPVVIPARYWNVVNSYAVGAFITARQRDQALGTGVSRYWTASINMVLQYKKVGRWKDYLFGERAYIVLSLTAKTVLAWLIFAGTLAPV